MLSGGALHRNTQRLIHSLADAALLDRQVVEQDFKLLLEELNGIEVYSHLWKYLDGERETQEFSL